MAGLDRQKRSNKPSAYFIMLTYNVIDSDAWRSMKPVSQSTWLLLARRYNGHNNGKISLSCREVSNLLGVSKDTASNAFKELMNRGFIKVGEDANFDMRVGRRARRWILTTRPMGNARKATDDWKKYKIKSPSD